MKDPTRRLLLFAFTLASGCANDAAPEEAPSTQKGVFFPTLSDAQKVDWNTAGLQIDAENPRSNFRRGQHLMAMLADAVYWSDDEFSQEASAHGFITIDAVHSETGPFGQTDADALYGVSFDGKMNFIAIRGSQQLSDFAIDAFVVPSPPWSYGGAPITLHQGFSQYADAVYDGLRHQLSASCDDTGSPKTPLFITGHSLGGAAASILAYRLAREGCNVAGASLFGTLRAGHSDWQSAYSGTRSATLPLAFATQRWVHKNDPFYCLPVGGAWKHVGLENRLDESGVHPGSSIDQHCDTPDGWIGGLKTALQYSDLPTNIAIGVQRAISDWLANLIQFTMFCQPDTNWDDVWSLGACSIVNSGNDFIQTYGVTPSEFLGEVINLVATKDHNHDRYANALSADFSEPVDDRPVVNLHLVIDELPDWYAYAYLVEPNSGGICYPDPDPQGRWFCDFPVRVGSPVRLEWAGYNDYWGYLAGDCPHPSFNTGAPNDRVCEFVVEQDMTITFRDVATLF